MVAIAFLVFYRFKTMNKEEAEKAKVEGETSGLAVWQGLIIGAWESLTS
jgi:hypothetical protein